MIGKMLGPYEIRSSIGAGGMGEVWRAQDTRLGRIVAIKKLTGQHSERFQTGSEKYRWRTRGRGLIFEKGLFYLQSKLRE